VDISHVVQANPLVANRTDDASWVVWDFRFQRRPWTVNAERAANRWQRARDTKEWRQATALYAKQHRVPLLTDATVTVSLVLKGRLQDTAACLPALKAVVDGLVDAGMFVDDTGDHVRQIVFQAPGRGSPDAMTVGVLGRLVTADGYTQPH
jgi:hypothetical protein